MEEVGSLFTGSRFLMAKNPRITLPIVSPEETQRSHTVTKIAHINVINTQGITTYINAETIMILDLDVMPNAEHFYSPVSSSSPTSTQRIENGGSRFVNPRSGGLEQLVTNWKEKLVYIQKQTKEKRIPLTKL